MKIKDMTKFNQEIENLRQNLLSILHSIPVGLKTVKHAELERQINECNDAETLLDYTIKVLDAIK